MRDEIVTKLRIDMLQAQSKTLAEILAKALAKKDNNEAAIQEYSSKLVNIRDKIEELLWVLDEKGGGLYSYSKLLLLEVHQVTLPNSKKRESLTIGQIIDKLKVGELTMDDLPSDVGDRVRKAILEMKKPS
ncbi:MAG TPA: hypothetical protein VE076_13505 [Nitrososphaeraceae archaeon]|nr:hypothetical protein [Nitrososphaeraceae archaeon]